MNYNSNRQLNLDVWNYNTRIRTYFIRIRCAVVVYSNYVDECFTLSGSNPTALYFFRILNYVWDIIIIIITVNLYIARFYKKSQTRWGVLVWGKEECLNMTFERLKGKINVLEIVRQRVSGCRTGVGKRQSPVRGQIDTGEVQFTTTSWA